MFEHEPAPEDQATGLRRMLQPRAPRLVCLAAAEPQRGADEACRIAASLDARGSAVLLVDLTRGELARAAGVLGRYELMHVLDRVKNLEQVVYQIGGTPVLPAARGMRALAGAWRGRERWRAALDEAGRAPRLVLAFADASALAPLGALAGTELRPTRLMGGMHVYS